MALIKKQKPIVKLALLVILIFVSILALFLAVFYAGKNNPEQNSGGARQSPSSKTMEEIINSLTAPVSGDKNSVAVSKDVIDSLTAPADSNSVSEDVINSLTAPAKK